MSTTAYRPPVSTDATKAIVEKYSLRSDRLWPMSKGDVINYLALDRGMSNANRMYESTTSRARAFLSPNEVKRNLDELVAKGEIFEVPGTHWSIRSGHGVRGNATYYLSAEARAFAIKRTADNEAHRFEQDARKAAEQAILLKYAKEVEAHFAHTMSGHQRVDTSLVW